MIYLILAVLCSSAVNVLMRLSEKHAKNSFVMFMANYAVCSLIAFLFMEGHRPFAPQEGMRFAVLLGLVSGAFYLGSLTLLRLNIARSGVMLSSVFMKLGVLVPTLMAILFFHEKPTVFQIIGFAIAIAAIVLIYLEPKKSAGESLDAASSARGAAGAAGAAGAGAFLLLLLIVSGLTESMANIYDELGAAAVKDHFLFCNFLTALALAGIMALIRHERVTWKDIAFGILIGVPNYFCTRFLLLSLSSLPAVVTYPVYNIGAIVLISLAGLLLFKERPGKRKLIGLAMILAALALLNM